MTKPYYEHGGITLFCGDCLEITDWTSADVLVCDPPYGMDFVSSKTTQRPIAGDKTPEVRDRALALWGAKPAAVFGNWKVPRPPQTRQLVTWYKASVGPGMGDLAMPWGSATEEIYICGEGWSGRRRPNLITTNEQRGNPYGSAALLGHPTPKPIGLMTELLECAPDGVVADPFSGVGATLLAARNLGRKAIGVELEEKYCETIAKRLSQEVLAL